MICFTDSAGVYFPEKNTSKQKIFLYTEALTIWLSGLITNMWSYKCDKCINMKK